MAKIVTVSQAGIYAEVEALRVKTSQVGIYAEIETKRMKSSLVCIYAEVEILLEDKFGPRIQVV